MKNHSERRIDISVDNIKTPQMITLIFTKALLILEQEKLVESISLLPMISQSNPRLKVAYSCGSDHKPDVKILPMNHTTVNIN